MRSISLALASVFALGCGVTCRDRKVAFIAAGGPIGILVAALDQCSDEPQPQPIAAVSTAGLQVPEQPDMASPPDIAQPSPDLSHPADMTTPPDLTKRPDVTLTIPLTSWIAMGQVIATVQDAGKVLAPMFDTRTGKETGATFEALLQLPPEAAQARYVDVTYTIDATTAWAAPTCTRIGSTAAAYKDPTSGACLEGAWYAGWSVDNSAKQGPTYMESISTGGAASIAGHDPFGQYVRVNGTSTYKLALLVYGVVDVSKLRGVVTMTLSF